MTTGPTDVRADRSPAGPRRPGMSFSVDGWDPTYGTSLELEEDLGESSAEVDVGIEVPPERWRPISAAPGGGAALPGAVRRRGATDRGQGVDRRRQQRVAGHRRIGGDLRLLRRRRRVLLRLAGAHFLSAETRRGLFTVAPHAEDIVTVCRSLLPRTSPQPNPKMPLSVTLSSALQAGLADIELLVAAGAREQTTGHAAGDDDLLVVDGPLRGRHHLPRALGYIKSHLAAYLPTEQHAMVGTLQAGQRTPVFRMGNELGPVLLVPATPLPAQRPLGRHRARRMLPRPAGRRRRRPGRTSARSRSSGSPPPNTRMPGRRRISIRLPGWSVNCGGGLGTHGCCIVRCGSPRIDDARLARPSHALVSLDPMAEISQPGGAKFMEMVAPMSTADNRRFSGEGRRRGR